MHRTHQFLKLILAMALLWAGCQPSPSIPQKSWPDLSTAEKRLPQNALLGLDVAPGYTLTQFAAEPLLINPTNMDIDSKGRVWVCEALNYRNKWNPKNPYRDGGDRILILEDRDQDGQADTSIVFYQGTDIDGALGIAVIGDQVIVSASPNVWVFTDADGDDVPEKQEKLFAGMGGVDDDHGHHAFVFGPDGRYYFNYGNAGAKLADANANILKDPNGNPITNQGAPFRQGMAVRCNPDGSEPTILGHNFRNNFELTVDSYGTVWQSDNDDDGNFAVRINYVMEGGNFGYTDEKTGAGWRAARVNSHPEIPQRHWHQNDPGVVPNLLMTGAGSPTGITKYEGRLLGDSIQQQLIHADAGPGVVRTYALSPTGAGYQARTIPLIQQAGDDWFRPSDVCVAPDGSLFISDWYDPIVGGNAMVDTARGRIYRLAPEGQAYSPKRPDLSSAAGAVAALQSPNVATRAAAWLALRDMGTSAESALKGLWQSADPHHQARALWLLARLPKGSSYLQQGLAATDTDLQITALRAARQTQAAPMPFLQQAAQSGSLPLLREVALALANEASPEADKLWASLAQQYRKGDRWYLEALGIGADRYAENRLQAWLTAAPAAAESPAGYDIIWRMRAASALPLLEKRIAAAPSGNAAKRYIRALDFHASNTAQASIKRLLGELRDDQTDLAYLLLMQIDSKTARNNPAIRKRLRNIMAQTEDPVAFLDLMERLKVSEGTDRLHEIALAYPTSKNGERALHLLQDLDGLDLFIPDLKAEPAQARKALEALKFADNSTSIAMLEQYAMNEDHPMALRKIAVESLANGWNSETHLANLLEADRLAEPLKIAGATKLLGVWRVAYRNLAANILKVEQRDDFTPITELLVMEGDPAAGPSVYKQHCITCHQINGEGINFGPALTEIGSKLSQEALYAAIMQPGAGISYGYEGYFVETSDGQKLTGYIASETASTITMRMQGGASKELNKASIIRQEPLEGSLMTTGLHQVMGEQALVDLVAYLRTLQRDAPELATR